MMNKNFLCRISVIFVFYCSLISVALANIVSVTKNDIDGGIDIITPYGCYFENDPLIIELIYSDVMQRLHGIMQYGPGDKVERANLYAGLLDDEVLERLKALRRLNPEVTKENLCYSRFDHSICTYVLYALKGRPRKEKIGGLLHDASHSALSHVGDVIYYENQSHAVSHQDVNLLDFLTQHGIQQILERHNMTLSDVTDFCDQAALWRKKPYLDRIDYTQVGALLAGLLSIKEFVYIVDNINFHKKGFWFFGSISSADLFMNAYIKLARLNMCAVWNTIVNAYVGKAVKRAMDLYAKQAFPNEVVLHSENNVDYVNIFSQSDFDYNKNDSEIWETLKRSKDKKIQQCMQIVLQHDYYISRYSYAKGLRLCGDGAKGYKKVRPKFREFDPYIKINRKYIHFSESISLDARYQEYLGLEQDTKRGLLINFKNFSIKPIRGPVLNGH